MCMNNISLNDDLVRQTRQKARQAIEAMRRQSEQNCNDTMTLDDINDEILQAKAERKRKHRHEALCGIFSSESSEEELVEDYLKDKYQQYL